MSATESSAPVRPCVLTVPGLGSSGPSHWQTLWEAGALGATRVELGMWDSPHRNVWLTRLDEAIRRARAPVILAAHSLGCVTVAWWAHLAARGYGSPVAGALLVAPADVDRPDCPPPLTGFAPAPRSALPFPSLVVASTDDPWIDIDQARRFAAQWGSHAVEVGELGHVNADSGLGEWRQGRMLLERVILAGRDELGRPRDAAEARAMLAGVTVRHAMERHAVPIVRDHDAGPDMNALPASG